jgi:hypothetical protein
VRVARYRAIKLMRLAERGLRWVNRAPVPGLPDQPVGGGSGVRDVVVLAADLPDEAMPELAMECRCRTGDADLDAMALEVRHTPGLPPPAS